MHQLKARTVSSIGVATSGRWAMTMSTYSSWSRLSDARRPAQVSRAKQSQPERLVDGGS
jgi:hypothetical protein